MTRDSEYFWLARFFGVMEQVFDSVCRCFGGVPAAAASSRKQNSISSPSSFGGRQDSPETKRRTSRLELQAEEWDGLFQRTPKVPAKQPSPIQYTHQTAEAPANPDLEYARAVAESKLAANPASRRSTSKQSSSQRQKSSKRKTPATKRDAIFRTRNFQAPSATASSRQAPPQVGEEGAHPMSRFFNNHQNVANALCFATPVREDGDDDAAPLNEPDDDSTLNTCEDTITSTLYFDSKYSHLVEKRPPMPLFHHFKVTEEEDHIRRIVATDSHNSLKMIRLMNPLTEKGVQLQDSSSDEEIPPAPPRVAAHATLQQPEVLQHVLPRRRTTSQSPPPPLPLKNSSNSSKSSKSTASTTPSSSSPLPDDGRLVHL